MKLPAVLFAVFSVAVCHISQVQVPNFWWDIAEDSSFISEVVIEPEEGVAFNDSKSRLWFWNFDWAEGLSVTWVDGEGRWTAWFWNSTVLPGLSGAGFVYDISTEKGDARAGAAWLRERDNGALIWNCFREGDLEDMLPWLSWRLKIRDNLIGFMKNGSRWGFMTGTDRIWSRYCNSAPSVGKRYQVRDGQEVARHVKIDPSAGTYNVQRNRVRRSPGYWDSFKKWWSDIMSDRPSQQSDDPQARADEPCRTIWDSLVKFVKWLFGMNDNGGGAPGDQPPATDNTETAANQKAQKDRESLDPKQNEAVPDDWE